MAQPLCSTKRTRPASCGPHGRGIAAEHACEREILAIVHTCGKALASAGAFVCGGNALKEYLINRARTFIFSTAMPPYFARQIQAALALAREADAERAHLREIASALREDLAARGFDCGTSATHIVPVMLGSNETALHVASELQRSGFAVRAIRPPTVPAGSARVRFSLTSRLSLDDIRRLAQAMDAACKSLPHIPLPPAPSMPERFFITGTDTGVGKTVVSALLCAALDAIYWKPIQTGTREGTDRQTVMHLARLTRARTIPEAYRFSPPVSPHLAAQRAGVRIKLRSIRMPRIAPSENLIVEGAGGALVPINETQLMTDLMRHLKLPVLLVARTALGTINHTLLSLAALRSARLPVRGVIMVGKPNLDNRRAIERYGDIQVVGIVPWMKKIDRRMLIKTFDDNFDREAFHA